MSSLLIKIGGLGITKVIGFSRLFFLGVFFLSSSFDKSKKIDVFEDDDDNCVSFEVGKIKGLL